MNKIKSMFLMFMALTLFIIPISLPDSGPINIIRGHNTEFSAEHNYKIERMRQINKKRIMEPVVMLLHLDIDGDITSTATGFSIKYDKKTNISYILTNEHFCDANDEFDNKGTFSYIRSDRPTGNKPTNLELLRNNLKLERMDASVDLCLLSTHGYIKPVILEKKGYLPSVMDKVYMVGAPRNIFPIVLEVYFSGFINRNLMEEEMREGENFFLISELIVGGQSGSPLFNTRGRVIGVVFMGFRDTYGGGVIPLADIYLFLEQ